MANPLGFNVTGLAAKVVTRAYHLYALPLTANRIRVATDWLLAAALPVQAVQLSGIRPDDALITHGGAHRHLLTTVHRWQFIGRDIYRRSAGCAARAILSSQPPTSSGRSGRAIR